MSKTAILPPPSPADPTGGQNLQLFRIYLVYRAVLSVVFLLLLSLPATRQLVGAQNPTLYTAVSFIFLFSNVAVLGVLTPSWQRSNTRLVALFTLDILCITLLSDASGGMASGLPLLMTITVASSALLISNRTVATLVAALAVIAVLVGTLRLLSIGRIGVSSLFSAGLLGALFFGVSAIMQVIALRLGRAEAIATERSDDLYRLQRLNEQIVQYMQTGIVLIDAQNRARVLNAAAGRLLDPSRPIALEQGRKLEDYSDELANRLAAFQSDGAQDGSPLKTREDGAEIVVRFHSLEASEDEQTLMFLEDYRPVAAYAQSLKLSSLGRLAASIAHEIRNPLGAISHATQLLQESDTLATDHRRMIDMVLTNTQRVNEIVESVLQVSRRQPPNPQLLHLAEWIDEYLELYRQAREDPGELRVEYVDPQAKARFDAEHLRRVLDNLIDNAMRHSEVATGTTRAELRIRVDRERQECIIDVYDFGKGVDERDIPRLFEPFFTRSRGGSGLGLYVCRDLCEINQARIAYAPTSDRRSRFQITVQQQEKLA
ncbi:MAG: ATP-binding protein [Congregibacter sp.]